MTYQQWKLLPNKDWITAPISPTCEVMMGFGRKICLKPTDKAYPTMGHGWMALCALHGKKHKEAFDICELISNGETFS